VDRVWLLHPRVDFPHHRDLHTAAVAARDLSAVKDALVAHADEEELGTKNEWVPPLRNPFLPNRLIHDALVERGKTKTKYLYVRASEMVAKKAKKDSFLRLIC
jgi:hypothetical protein